MRQLGFSFLNEDDYNINNFIVFDGNNGAYYFLNRSKDDENILDNQLIFLSGEKKCGKTHLGYIWKQQHNAKNLYYDDLFSLNMNDFIKTVNEVIERFDYYILDDLRDDFDEEKLLYLINTVFNNSSVMLIISDFNILKKKISIKDLKSRINAGVNLKIKKLSKTVKTMFIVKLFADRQININGDVLKYLTKKLDTNYNVIFNFVKNIDDILVSDKNKINLKLIKELI
ncbi:MAG: hypothetical protein IJ853_02835 [Rickettsiales bacterium]|nr:hypothetical protein [Rickettsiales bacterium]